MVVKFVFKPLTPSFVGSNPATPVKKPFFRVFLTEIHEGKVFFLCGNQPNLRATCVYAASII